MNVWIRLVLFFRFGFVIWSDLFLILYFDQLLFVTYFVLFRFFLFYHSNYSVVVVFSFIVSQGWVCHIVCYHVRIMRHFLHIFIFNIIVAGNIFCQLHCFCIKILVLMIRIAFSAIHTLTILINATFVVSNPNLFAFTLLF